MVGVIDFQRVHLGINPSSKSRCLSCSDLLWGGLAADFGWMAEETHVGGVLLEKKRMQYSVEKWVRPA